ncbi:MAG: hypothetical protein MPW14_01105 [Candidatus Manganitrophus sp.]|nr:MAG: hypothetical protein MPW14_01105 [Candidatus Manganitrophus sp.]
MVNDPFLPHPAEIVEVRRETPGVYTYRLRFRDEGLRRGYRFLPGQFNMVYVFGVGEVAISIVSDPDDPELLDHTIRIVGNVTGALERLKEGDTIGLRGPYGSAWPLKEAEGKEVIVVTGGLGCAPVVSVINYIAQRREQYGKLKILHGGEDTEGPPLSGAVPGLGAPSEHGGVPHRRSSRQSVEVQRRRGHESFRSGRDRSPTFHCHDVRAGDHDALYRPKPPLPRDRRRSDLRLIGTEHEVRDRFLRTLPARPDLRLPGGAGLPV